MTVSVNNFGPAIMEQLDFIVFVAATLIVVGFLHRRFWMGAQARMIRWVMWPLVLGLLAGGWFFIQASERHEGQVMRRMLEGYAPTFASEMERRGHQEITLQTSPDDPRYWQLIQMEKRWLAVNPSINDVYTLRKLPDGRVALVVDSETDYNRDGVFEGEREERTQIGEIYDSPMNGSIDLAFAGQPVFQEKPYTDRWGTWVSSLVPLHSFNGKVEAVLGVNFDAATWAAAATRARRTAIAYLAVLLLLVAGVGGVFAHRGTARKLELEVGGREALRLEKQKLETLIDSIDGIVWEAEPVTLRSAFVSRQCERLLGYSPAEWVAKDGFWQSKLHPDDAWAVDHSKRMAAAKEPYSYDYRMIAADGRTVWIRENAAVLADAAGKPLLIRGVLYDITALKHAAKELEAANAALVDSSRFAGMAEVATGVLHNVGNVLNSVNVSGNVISERLRRSKVIELGKVAGLLTLQAADFAGFVARDPRGPHIPELISRVAEALRAEHADLIEEVDSITKNIAHIKEIVSMQQGFAKGDGIVEPLGIQALVDDAIKINSASLTRHRIAVVQAYEEVPHVVVDKHLILQILVNLLRNAKQAVQESGIEPRRIVVKIKSKGTDFVTVAVQDTGIGIAPENLTRIFSHGFTTKKNGHGFGLHSSALAASGMGGSLNVQSDGPGKGATFILELPVHQAAPIAAAA